MSIVFGNLPRLWFMVGLRPNAFKSFQPFKWFKTLPESALSYRTALKRKRT